MSPFRILCRKPASGLTALVVLTAMTGSALAQNLQGFVENPDDDLKLPNLNSYAPTTPGPQTGLTTRTVVMEAVLGEEGEPVQQGLTWRIFQPIPGTDGKLPLLASSEGGPTTFDLAPGDYFIHVSFGRAGVTKKLSVPRTGPVEKQRLVLNAGGLVLNAVSGNGVRIAPAELSFKIYQADNDVPEFEQQLVLDDVKPNTIVRLNAGTYHIVSDYGDNNAIMRSDIRVETGKLTEAVIQHRAAELTLKLVSEEGGEAIADTAWSILTSGGDVVSETVGAFPRIVLAEGQYTAIARNKNQTYSRDFDVVAGHNADVEVLLK